jgi:hypothetical protein
MNSTVVQVIQDVDQTPQLAAVLSRETGEFPDARGLPDVIERIHRKLANVPCLKFTNPSACNTNRIG